MLCAPPSTSPETLSKEQQQGKLDRACLPWAGPDAGGRGGMSRGRGEPRAEVAGGPSSVGSSVTEQRAGRQQKALTTPAAQQKLRESRDAANADRCRVGHGSVETGVSGKRASVLHPRRRETSGPNTGRRHLGRRGFSPCPAPEGVVGESTAAVLKRSGQHRTKHAPF